MPRQSRFWSRKRTSLAAGSSFRIGGSMALISTAKTMDFDRAQGAALVARYGDL
jgi:hypothetical protein